MSAGSQHSTVVPAPGVLSTRTQPPASSARSTIVVSPRWPGSGAEIRSGWNPTPSSITRTIAPSATLTASIRTAVAWACLRALTTASCAIRYSSADRSGSGSSVSSSCTSTVQPVAFAVCST